MPAQASHARFPGKVAKSMDFATVCIRQQKWATMLALHPFKSEYPGLLSPPTPKALYLLKKQAFWTCPFTFPRAFPNASSSLFCSPEPGGIGAICWLIIALYTTAPFTLSLN